MCQVFAEGTVGQVWGRLHRGRYGEIRSGRRERAIAIAPSERTTNKQEGRAEPPHPPIVRPLHGAVNAPLTAATSARYSPAMDLPDLTIVDQRQVAPGRVRSLLRLVDQGKRRWYVAEIDRIIDCGRDWNRAVGLLAAEELHAPQATR